MKKILFITLVLIIGILIGISIPKTSNTIQKTISLDGVKKAQMPIVAVDSNGNGVTSTLLTEIRPGSGLVLVNINNVLADYNMQLSARTAAKVASNYTNISLSNIDIIYSIETSADLVEGPSAGASMAISTIIMLQNKTLKKDVVISGLINEDSTISQSGGLDKKILAAKQSGIKTFLLNKQPFNKDYEPSKKCNLYENIEYCEVRFVQKSLTTEESGIIVVEVNNIKEALEYFYNED